MQSYQPYAFYNTCPYTIISGRSYHSHSLLLSALGEIPQAPQGDSVPPLTPKSAACFLSHDFPKKFHPQIYTKPQQLQPILERSSKLQTKQKKA